jgi:hypothetical protein
MKNRNGFLLVILSSVERRRSELELEETRI